MQNWPSADDDAVRAAAALVATPIPVMPGEAVGDELRLRCFSNAHDAIDRVGLETDFAAVKRRRPDLGSCGVIVPRGVPTNAVVQQDCVVPMLRLVSPDEEAAERQFELLTQLSDSNMSLAFALEHHVAQARKVGVPLTAACYSRLVELAAASDDMARLMDLLDEMRRNDVVLTSHTLNLSIRAVAEKNAAVALTLLDSVPDVQVSRRTWRLVANRILSDAVAALLAVQAGGSPFPPGVSMSRVAGIVERAGGSERFDPVLAVALAAASALLSPSPMESLAALSAALARCTDEDQRAAAKPLAAVAVSVLLRRACDTSDPSGAADRPAARLAIVQAAKQHGVALHAEDFASLLRACKAERDTRGVVYFLMLHAAGTASVDAAIAAAEMLANDIFDADVRASLGVSRTRAFKAFIDKAELIRASVPLPERLRVVDALAKLARHDADVDVLMSVLATNLLPYMGDGSAGDMVPSAVRRTVAATTRSLPAWAKAGPSAGQRAAAAIAADGADPRLMAAVFAGLPGASELESAAMQVMPAFGAADVAGTIDAAAVSGLVGRPSADGVYIMVLDAAAWARLAADPKAAAAVARMMSAYDKAAGGCLVVGLDAVFLAPDTEPLAAAPKPAKARAATLAAEWAKLYPGWFRLLPLCCSVAVAASRSAEASDDDVAADDGMWWITAWASQLRAAGAKKQVTVVGSRGEAAATAAVASKVAERAGVKPVLAADDLLKKLGV